MVSYALADLGLVRELVTLSVLSNVAGSGQEKLDGTNNVTEQVIGQCVKERYRTIRGYKRQESIRNVSSLIGWMWTKGADYNLGEVVAN